MALTLIPQFELTVTLAALDEEGKIVTRDKVYAIEGVDFATAQVNRDAFLADLALATSANIVKHSMREVYADPVAPTSTFNLWRELVITFNLATVPLKRATHVIPAPSLNLVNLDAINLGHADTTAYLNNFLVTGGIVTVSDGEFITDTNNVAASKVRQAASGKRY